MLGEKKGIFFYGFFLRFKGSFIMCHHPFAFKMIIKGTVWVQKKLKCIKKVKIHSVVGFQKI